MANPYHDENGMFCSKGEMQGAITRLEKAGDVSAALQLKGSLTHIEAEADFKERGAAYQKANEAPVAKPVVVRARKSFFADASTLDKRGASHTSTSADELTELSKSKDAITRIGVAANRNTPVAALTKLAGDKDWGVRAGVAKNSSAPREVLEKLSSDENSWVVDALKKNRAYVR